MTGKLDNITAILDSRMPEWGVLLLDATYHKLGFFLEDDAWPPWATSAILHPEVAERIRAYETPLTTGLNIATSVPCRSQPSRAPSN